LVLEKGLRDGRKTVTTASTGNAAVATAIGAAAAGMDAVIFLPQRCDPGKVRLMVSTGARVYRVAEGYRAAVALSRGAARRYGWVDRNTGTNPLTLEAKKTVAFEIWEQLGRTTPDLVAVPVGDGPTLIGLAKGFEELRACGAISRMPRLLGIQAENCKPIVRAWAGEAVRPADLDPAATMADGIAVTQPACGSLAIQCVADTHGALMAVPDSALVAATSSLARAGVLSDAAGAAGLAGLEAALERDVVDPSWIVVVLVTGRGFASARGDMIDLDVPVVHVDLDKLDATLDRIVICPDSPARGGVALPWS
jgi:threonine synthase